MESLIQDWKDFSRSTDAVLAFARTEADYERLLALMHAVLERMEVEGETPELDSLLHIVGTLVLEWEREHEPGSGEATPAEMLAYIMEGRGLTQSALAEQIGVDQGLISKVLSGRRAISKALANKLGARFGLDPANFL